MGYQNDVLFFHEQAVHRAIDHIATAPKVVLYVGAGATIDRTGLDWRSLIEKVLGQDRFHDRGHVAVGDAAIVASALQPVEAATLAGHYYRQVDGLNWLTSLETSLRTFLYRGDGWKSGRLCTNVIRLAVALAESTRTDVHIVTTNFDTHLEDEYLEQARLLTPDDGVLAEFPALAVEVLGTGAPREVCPAAKSSGRIHLSYLHGRVPRTGDCEGRLGLTELDYFELRQPVLDKLRELFLNAAVLILGSSLTDPPLLAALQATAPVRPLRPGHVHLQRFALTPVVAYRFQDTTHARVDTLKKHLGNRMQDFDVKLLFPDFYYQVPQFCEEVIAALRAPAGSRYASRKTIRFGHRFSQWATTWENGHLTKPGIEAAYSSILTSIDDIKEHLAPRKDYVPHSADEKFKVEVWARWKPGGGNRSLALWAMSSGVRWEWDSVHVEALDSDSPYDAVLAYIEGAPRVHRLVDTPANPDKRWRTFLSVPIYFDGGSGSIPVGVITLAGSRGAGNSRVEVSSVEDMQLLVDALTLCGSGLLAPAGPA